MDGMILLRQARAAGLRVATDGDRLVVQGPRRLEPVARTLLAEELVILRALAEEPAVAWRIDAMRPQVTTGAAIPLLLARPGIRFPSKSCCSCGDALAAADHYRCGSCVSAVVAILEELG